MNGYGGLIINSSRSIIYADGSESFADKARESALKLQREMAVFL
jgi:orotidine-5'-phosphate decarboxylase